MQQFLKSAGRPTRAKVVAAQLFYLLLAAVDYARAVDRALDARFGWETLLPCTRCLETEGSRYVVLFS